LKLLALSPDLQSVPFSGSGAPPKRKRPAKTHGQLPSQYARREVLSDLPRPKTGLPFLLEGVLALFLPRASPWRELCGGNAAPLKNGGSGRFSSLGPNIAFEAGQ
jgi:hypothetical protein